LNNAHFHSITGSQASHQIFHKPKTADPSEITATVFAFKVYLYAFSVSLAISLQGSATQGVYAKLKSSFVFNSNLISVEIFPCIFSCNFKLSAK
jgi:hypothetical protein